MTYILSFLAMLAGIATIALVRAYARRRVKAAIEYRDATSAFFDATGPLLSDDQTPEEIIELICTLNATIQDKGVAARLVSYPMRTKWSDRSQRLFKVSSEFFHARPELEDSFLRMFHHWFIAVTALAPISGIAARYSLNNPKSISDAAARESRRAMDHHNDNGNSGSATGVAHAH